MNDMRPLVFLVYVGVLGWMLRGMWDRTRERIVQDARWEVINDLERKDGTQETPPAAAAQ